MKVWLRGISIIAAVVVTLLIAGALKDSLTADPGKQKSASDLRLTGSTRSPIATDPGVQEGETTTPGVNNPPATLSSVEPTGQASFPTTSPGQAASPTASVTVLLIANTTTPGGFSPTASMTPSRTRTAVSSVTMTPTRTAPAVPSATRTFTPSLVPSATRTPPSPEATSTSQPASRHIVVNHNSVALFESIPESYLLSAANLNMLFIDRSVGDNINNGLTCLSFESDEAAPNFCSRYQHVVPAFSVNPAEVNWFRPGGYNRSNWSFEFWPDGGCSSWDQKVECFLTRMQAVINQYDVVSFQFSYLAVDESSSIAAQPGGFFSNNANRFDVYDQEAYEQNHPGKVFIYWTSSLARGIGTAVSESFNTQMRQYTSTHQKILFDVADILSHDPSGSPCYDNRDGIPYSTGNNSENYPDDGVNRLAICQHYTTEVDGGHLGSVSAGMIRVAKAYWVLMAQVAGWNP